MRKLLFLWFTSKLAECQMLMGKVRMGKAACGAAVFCSITSLVRKEKSKWRKTFKVLTTNTNFLSVFSSLLLKVQHNVYWSGCSLTLYLLNVVGKRGKCFNKRHLENGNNKIFFVKASRVCSWQVESARQEPKSVTSARNLHSV